MADVDMPAGKSSTKSEGYVEENGEGAAGGSFSSFFSVLMTRYFAHVSLIAPTV